MCSPTKIDLTYYKMNFGSAFESGAVRALTLAAWRKETLGVYQLLGFFIYVSKL